MLASLLTVPRRVLARWGSIPGRVDALERDVRGLSDATTTAVNRLAKNDRQLADDVTVALRRLAPEPPAVPEGLRERVEKLKCRGRSSWVQTYNQAIDDALDLLPAPVASGGDQSCSRCGGTGEIRFMNPHPEDALPPQPCDLCADRRERVSGGDREPERCGSERGPEFERGYREGLAAEPTPPSDQEPVADGERVARWTHQAGLELARKMRNSRHETAEEIGVISDPIPHYRRGHTRLVRASEMPAPTGTTDSEEQDDEQ